MDAAASIGAETSTPVASRAWFITDNGVIVYPNAERSSSLKQTMLGLHTSDTVNGTGGTGGSATVLSDSEASFPTSPTNALKDGKLMFDGLPSEIDGARFKEIYGEDAVQVEIQ